ncbi:MAG: adenine phosphoribosyltransferase [Bradymonadia bacterium]
MDHIRQLVRDIPDFPKAGILFKDITPVLSNAAAFNDVVQAMADLGRGHITHVVGIESRGFIFGTPVAQILGLPFVPVRKPGKLPAETARVEYALEYGTDALEIHADALGAGDRVMIVDDLLATGGTANAACQLCEGLGAEVVSLTVLIELSFLEGAKRLEPRKVNSLLTY